MRECKELKANFTVATVKFTIGLVKEAKTASNNNDFATVYRISKYLEDDDNHLV